MAIIYPPSKGNLSLKKLDSKTYSIIISDPEAAIGPLLVNALSNEYSPFELVRNYNQVESPGRREMVLFVCLMKNGNVDPSHVIKLRKRFPSRPILVIDYETTTDRKEIYDSYDVGYEPWNDDLTKLASHIKVKLDRLTRVKITARRSTDPTRLYSLSEVADQIDTIAGAISDLRLNSTSQAVDNLLSISSGLRRRPNIDVVSSDRREPRSAVKEALLAISAIYDAIENGKLAAIVVSGAVSALIGGVGWPATLCFTVAMASWNGKDAFMAAINRLPAPKLPKSLPKD